VSGSSEGEGTGGELVSVAYAEDWVQAEMIQGLLQNGDIPCLLQPAGMTVDGPGLGVSGVLSRGFGGGPQRVMVHANRGEEARALLAETLVEDDESSWPEPVNAEYLEEASGRKPRSYGLLGAYARIYLWSLFAMVLICGLYFLSRVL
jgi:putative signal transducing protein